MVGFQQVAKRNSAAAETADSYTGGRTVICVRCGSAARLGRLWCAKCSGEKTNEPPESLASRPTNAIQFSIESLLLVTTLAAICLGIFVADTVLGIFISVWAGGALARTVVVARHCARQGRTLALLEKIGSFVMSLAVVFGVVVAGITAVGVVAEVNDFIGQTFFEYRSYRGPLGEFLRRVLGFLYIICFIAAPLAAGGYSLWLTRPR